MTAAMTVAAACGPSDATRDAGLDPDRDGGVVEPTECAVQLTADGVLDIDIPVVRVSGRITIGGAPAEPHADGPYLELVQTDRSRGALIDWADIGPGGQYDVRIVPGRYQLRYHYPTCQDPAFPCQQNTVIVQELALGGDGGLDIDIPIVELSGRVTVHGGPPPAVSGSRGVVGIRGEGAAIGRIVWLDETPSGNYTARIIPGRYAITYSNEDAGCSGAVYPCQRDALVRAPLALTAPGRLDVDLTPRRVTGRITLDGAPLPGAAYSAGVLHVRGRDGSTGWLVQLDRAGTSSYDVRLLPGEYDILYTNADPGCTGAPYPCQRDVPIVEAVTVETDGALDVALETRRVTGRISLDGEPLPGAPYSRGVLEVVGRGPSRGTLVALDDIAAGTYDVRLFPGTYEVVYGNWDPGCTGNPYPCQQDVSIAANVGVTSDGALDLDLSTVRVVGRVTMDGAPLPAASYGRGQLALRGTGSRGSIGRLVALDDLASGNYEVVLFPDTYSVEYTNVDSRCTGSPYPCQRDAVVLPSVTLTASGSLDVDIPVIDLTGTISLDGASLPSATYDRGWIVARGPPRTWADLADLEATAGPYAARLVPGLYDLLYESPDPRCDGSTFPCQTAVLACDDR